MAAALMVVSCAREDKPSQEVEKVTADEQRISQERVEEIEVKEQEAPPMEVEETTAKGVGLQTIPRQARDIMSGKPINRSIYTDYAGKRIYFCCAESRKQFSAQPELCMKMFREQGITLEDSPAKR